MGKVYLLLSNESAENVEHAFTWGKPNLSRPSLMVVSLGQLGMLCLAYTYTPPATSGVDNPKTSNNFENPIFVLKLST